MLLCTTAILAFLLAVANGLVGHQQHYFQQHQSAFESLSFWINKQRQYAQSRILANIAPFADDPSAMAGAVCASPSRSHPDYYYAWTRDSALVMGEILNWLEQESPGNSRQLNIVLDNYVAFTRHIQAMDTRLGEAKFNMDGSPFTGSWCNAQTDGPAIRALVLIRLTEHRAFNVGQLFGLIRVDLDYISRVWWQNSHCDIWEESRGLHFYTAMAQHRALRAGALLALRLGDIDASQKYSGVADEIETLLLPRFSTNGSHVLTTIEWSGGLSTKTSNLDTQVLLASLHYSTEGMYSVGSSEMVSTVLAILRRFEHMYDINRVPYTDINGISVPIGVAVGRYPEDVYNGVGTSLGNPWSLVTSALAEYHYRLALAYADSGYFVVGPELVALLNWTAPYIRDSTEEIYSLQAKLVSKGDREFRGLLSYLLAAGDLYMARVARHTGRDHTMNEQWNMYTGYGRGAIHLTWSYAAHTSAARARSKLVSIIY
ncbi:hypothetical protein GGI13_000670 [Coemansia sp. RSA 455]|nr:hypothetical protein GGI13_000670 [Coemansia sp. RSA 455]